MSIPAHNRRLHDAVTSGDLPKVIAVVDAKVLGPVDITLVLAEAVFGGHTDIVEYLIQQGADMHYFDKSAPLLVTAVLRKNMPMFYELLKHCRNINFEYSKGNMAHAAVKIKSLTVLKELEKFPKRFLLFDKTNEVHRRTPLHEAVVVICRGKTTPPQSPKDAILNCPLNSENLAKIDKEEHFPKPLDEREEDKVGERTHAVCLRSLSTEMELVSFPLETEIVRFLLDRGCNPNTKDIYHRTPLHDAAASGNLDLVLLLLTVNVSLYEEDRTGSLPWTEAVNNGYENVASYLLKEKDFYQRLTGHRKNCNHAFAAIGTSVACVQYLIKRGMDMSDLRLIDQEGMTPLIKAVRTGQKASASLLVRFSAYVINEKTTTEYTAVDFALHAWQTKEDAWWGKILNDMVKHGANLNQYVGIHKVHILMQREYLINPWKLDWILLHSLDLNVKSKEGWYLFQLAIHHISIHRPNHIGIKVLFKLLNHGMWVPEQFVRVKSTKDASGNDIYKSSPILEALRAQQVVLVYLLHLIGCHSGENEIDNWFHSGKSQMVCTSKCALEMVQYLLQNENQPMPLHDITRIVILKSLPKGDVREHAKLLPLPIKLQKRLDWEHEVDCKPKALPVYYKVIKEMLYWPEDQPDSPEWEGFCFVPEITFEF